MRLLYFSRDYNTHDRRFLSALARTDHQVYALHLERRGHVLEERPLPPQVEIIPWAGGVRPVTRVDGPRLLRDLKRVIRQVQPDLVQAGPLQTAAFLVALAGFRPLLSMSWGYDLIQDAGRSPLWRWATRFTLRRSAALLGDSAVVRQLAVSNGMPDKRIVTFPWGIDLQHYSPASSAQADGRGERMGWGAAGLPADVFVLLSTRNWEPIYGVEVLAQGFAKAAGRHPELRLLMLGSGSLASRLRQIFMQAGVLDRVHFPGYINQADLPRYYRSADLYLSASHSDGSSISLLEAMACSLPVLVSDIPGNCEWVSPGQQGWHFKDGDAQALAEAIELALSQRSRLAELGRSARSLVERRADWEENFKILLSTYENILS